MASAARFCFRPVMVRAATRSLSLPVSRTLASLSLPHQAPLLAPRLSLASVRLMSSQEPLSLQTIQDRIMLVLGLYDKIDPAKLTIEAHFIKDLGLDSLDHVEVILAMEDEFGFEIPDAHGEKLLNVKQMTQYVADHQDIYH